MMMTAAKVKYTADQIFFFLIFFLAHSVNMIKGGFDLFVSFIHSKNLNFQKVKQMKVDQESHYEITFSNTRWPQLLVPLKIAMSKISLKYIAIHINNF